ncbi:hypothetical protein Q3G72_006669 [Acer saccharum]|nr:hypothetical protein Q3G72_006669 [Acer saccharum]
MQLVPSGESDPLQISDQSTIESKTGPFPLHHRSFFISFFNLHFVSLKQRNGGNSVYGVIGGNEAREVA